MKSCSHKGEKSGDSLLCVGKEQSCLIQVPPSSRSLILSNFNTTLLWNVPRHRCAARQAASTPQWIRDKCFCICLAECWNWGTWERKAIRREWNARWWRITGEIHTRAAVPTVGTSKSCTGYLKHEPSSPTSPIPRAHPPVAQVPDEIRVVHLQLLSRHIHSEVLGRTVRYNVRYHLMKQQTKGPSLAYVTLKMCSLEFFPRQFVGSTAVLFRKDQLSRRKVNIRQGFGSCFCNPFWKTINKNDCLGKKIGLLFKSAACFPLI